MITFIETNILPTTINLQEESSVRTTMALLYLFIQQQREAQEQNNPLNQDKVVSTHDKEL